MNLNWICKTIGLNIKEYRNSAGISQEKLAEISGLHRTYIGAVERGERNITIINLCRIAFALRIEPQLLLKDIKERGTSK